MHTTALKPLLAACALAFVALFSGCASVTRGTKDTLVIESDPAGATVRLSTGQTGKTPTSFQLPRKHGFDVYIEKEGYEPLTVHVSSQVSGTGAAGMAGNVLVGGLIGVGVDAMTGATKDLRPNPVKVSLVPLKPVPVQTAQLPVPPPAPPATPAPAPAPAPAATVSTPSEVPAPGEGKGTIQ